MAGLSAEDIARRVLVVDDDADWREFLKLCLEDLGYVADEACDGEAALASLKRSRFGVMLLDLHMPGLSGEEVASRMPQKGSPRIVFLTSAAAQEVTKALRTGPHYYLPKGASREELSLLLQSLEA